MGHPIIHKRRNSKASGRLGSAKKSWNSCVFGLKNCMKRVAFWSFLFGGWRDDGSAGSADKGAADTGGRV